jgi:hypothetical protein
MDQRANCPSLEMLAAFLDGGLGEDRPAVEAHLVNCGLCRATLALSIQLEDDCENPQGSTGGGADADVIKLQPANF